MGRKKKGQSSLTKAITEAAGPGDSNRNFNKVMATQKKEFGAALATGDQEKYINQKLTGAVEKSSLFKCFREVFDTAEEFERWMVENKDAIDALDGRTKASLLNALNALYVPLTGMTIGKAGYNIDHTDISNMASKAVAMYIVLQETKLELGNRPSEKGRKRMTTNDKGKRVPIGSARSSGVEFIFNQAEAGLDEVISKIQSAIGIMEYLTHAYANGKEPTAEQVEKDYEEYVKSKGETWNLTTFKRKIIDSAAGNAEQVWTVMSEDTNKVQKGFFEGTLPHWLNDLIPGRSPFGGKGMEEALERIDALHSKTIENTKIVGSVPIENEIVDQIAKAAIGIKPRKYAPTPKKGKVPIKMKQPSTAGVRAAMKRHTREVGRAKEKLDSVRQKAQGRLVKTVETNVDDLRETAKIRAAINRKLPTELRKNMVRPALMNRTGRFANSVKLETLTATQAGMAGQYSYLLSPYETFESKGKRKWPLAYNPKPLISKSIRNIAIGFMKAKLTLRRI